MLQGNFMVQKEERPQISNLAIHLKKIEKKIQSKKKENTVKARVEMNEIENRKPIEIIIETKNLFFEKISNIDKLLTRLKQKRGDVYC